MPPKDVANLVGVSQQSISRLRKKARERGYDPNIDRKILLKYVEDGPRTGRPKTAVDKKT